MSKHFENDNFDVIIENYTQAIKLNPNYKEVYLLHRGDAYLSYGDYDNAIKDYTQAIKLNPNHIEAYKACIDAYNKLGDMHEIQGNSSKATVSYAVAIKLKQELMILCENDGLY